VVTATDSVRKSAVWPAIYLVWQIRLKKEDYASNDTMSVLINVQYT